MTTHTYTSWDNLFDTLSVKPIPQSPIIDKIRKESARKEKPHRYTRNITCHADPVDYKGYETHAFNQAGLSQIANRYSKAAASAVREGDDLLWAA